MAILTVVSGCDPGEDPITVNFEERLPDFPSQPLNSAHPIRIAVAPILAPKRNLLLYLDLVRHIGELLQRPPELVTRDTYAEVNYLLKERLIDVAFVCTYPYVEGHRGFGMELLAAPRPAGDRKVEAYLIVRKGAPYHSLSDLRGRTFAFTDPLSNTGMLLPTARLLQMNETPDSFFRETIFTYNHSNSIQAVAAGQVDAASVLSLVWEFERDTRPEVAGKTTVLERWGSGGLPPVVVHPNMELESKARLRSLFLGLHERPEGRRILKRLGIERFVVPDDSDYGPVRKMAEAVDRAWRERRGR